MYLIGLSDVLLMKKCYLRSMMYTLFLSHPHNPRDISGELTIEFTYFVQVFEGTDVVVDEAVLVLLKLLGLVGVGV